MTQTPCVVCRRRPPDGFTCAPCRTWMADQLTEIVEFYALAEGELLPGSGTGTRTSEPGIGVRIAALDYLAGHDAVTVLASWESEWREHYGLSVEPMLRRPAPMLVRSVAFLRAWLDRACFDHPAIDDFARELADCWAEGRAAARMEPARTVAITCPADLEATDPDGQPSVVMCGRRIPVDADHATGQVQCRRCRTTWDIPHLMHVAISTPGAELWADPEAAAGYFRITSKTLRQWARAGRIRRDHGRYELHSIHAAIHGVSDTG